MGGCSTLDYDQLSSVSPISTNHSDIDELSFEQKGNMSIHLLQQRLNAVVVGNVYADLIIVAHLDTHR